MLHLHRATRADALVDALRETLATPPAEPFATEVIAVPSKGVERWIAQRLSLHLGATTGRLDGICANVAFPSPRAVIDGALAGAADIDPDEDPWGPGRAVWPLLEVVDVCRDEAWLGALHAHLERSRGRLGAVRHIAGLFDSYALHRPEMLVRWASGDDTGVPTDAAWQAELWRRLRARLDTPSPPERLAAACARLRDEPGLADLPERLTILGLTRLPAARLQVLAALAAHRDVYLHLLHPSPALWEKAAATLGAQVPSAPRRSDDPTAALPDNRLLASWGQDARELQVVLAASGPRTDVQHDGEPTEPTTLLARLQTAVRADAAPSNEAAERAPLGLKDDSLLVHSCHGRARQVDVLRDALLHVLADDPTLEPRDIIVLCPDIEAYAPLIHATFGSGEVLEEIADDVEEPTGLPDRPDLRVRLADRALRQTNPVLGVVARLLELAGARVTASEVLDLADREPVRRRFRLDDDDMARAEGWVAASGVRWGLDAPHRGPFDLQHLSRGTWQAGLDRVLIGVTTTEDEHRLVGGVLPLDDVGSSDIDLAGRLAELVHRLTVALDALTAAQPLSTWADALLGAADALTSTRPLDAWQRQELATILTDLVDEATTGDTENTTVLTLADVRALLADRLRGRPTCANFRTGHLTICTLVPMRAVPHRVVCLLGLDDEVFPRAGTRDGDDLVLHDPHVGDRDARLEDRQLLLDALMSAGDRLLITYSGSDERTNAKRPPAVPVGELLDVVDRTVRVPTGRPRDRIVVEHPLQPFDPRNFTAGELQRDTPWGFDAPTLAGARALDGPRTSPGRFLPGPLPGIASRSLEVDDLVRFVQKPVRTFLRRRLGITVGEYDDEIDDALPIELDDLEKYGVGSRLLDMLLHGAAPKDAVSAERARGFLPPGALGQAVINEVWPKVDAVLACARDVLDLESEPESLDVRAVLADGQTLSGTVAGVAGDVLRSVSYATLGPQHRIAAWVRLVALTAAHPERPFQAITVGRRKAQACVSRIGPLGDDPQTRSATALKHLAALSDLMDRGLREPLPIACKTSHAYADAVSRGFGAPGTSAAREWVSEFRFDKEDREPEHLLAFGGQQPISFLLAPPPRTDERAWHEQEQTRFGVYARRLWSGVFAHEQIETR
ncbi:exodeoxyribonuclease V subunit gamma [Baekduia soli]|uniref:RecBCD enzyme subunit RecC n=1 Tax=Baekduia soli TaxID=496014 RepID=A0A5B8U2Z6_9ACTN|nr:exodeoxyribonuclease V subunit gamma [Baekduia soli]QEC47292.1 exodeoxyribonuclease V subunit gamma [Baekduia soli]